MRTYERTEHARYMRMRPRLMRAYAHLHVASYSEARTRHGDTLTRISHLKLPCPSRVSIIHACDSVNSPCAGVMCNTHLIVCQNRRARVYVCSGVRVYPTRARQRVGCTHQCIHMHAYKAKPYVLCHMTYGLASGLVLRIDLLA